MALASGDRIEAIQRDLLRWFAENGRDLPWRQTRDPYAILVSEVMLQQTQVDRVIPYYRRFLERFPSVGELAAAPTSEVIRIWSGLGYNRRAVNLQRAARTIVDDFGGTFPSDPATLQQLPGVGAYTAGAIAAFAYEQDAAFFDTNMRRVITRVLFGPDAVPESQVLEGAKMLLPTGKGWVWNQALIEFGALQCTARNPACIVCPLGEVCAARPLMQGALRTRRSKSRPAQSASYETSNRYYRGRVIEFLRTVPEYDETGIDLAHLGPRVREGFSEADLPWLRCLISGLERDGLAVISEDSPTYDAETPSDQVGTRVRLP